MKTSTLKRARELWCNQFTPVHTQRHNIRAWIKSIKYLGEHHLLAKQIMKVKL
jgi:hypothetical protein